MHCLRRLPCRYICLSFAYDDVEKDFEWIRLVVCLDTDQSAGTLFYGCLMPMLFHAWHYYAHICFKYCDAPSVFSKNEFSPFFCCVFLYVVWFSLGSDSTFS